MGCIFKMCILYWLIANIRCIEINIVMILVFFYTYVLIANIRCIEINDNTELLKRKKELIANIRCIEIL